MTTMPSDIPRAIRRRLRQAFKRTRKLAADIAKAGSRRQIEKAQRLFLGSLDPKIVAAYRARKSFPRDRRPPPSAILEVARNVNVWKPCAERVMLRLEEKKVPGTYRLIYDFGMENRTRQHLVAACLKPRFKPHPCQYASGGGTHAAVKAAAEEILAGNRYAVKADIDNFYNSVRAENLADLPIPKKVMETVILAKAYNLWPGWIEDQDNLTKEVNKLKLDLASHPEEIHESPDTSPSLSPPCIFTFTDEFPAALDEALGGHLVKGRLGIPAGSPCSSLIAEMLLTPTVEQISNCGVLVQYADDFMVFGASIEGAVLTMQTLRSALKSHPAGPFSVKETTYKPGAPFDFLGFRLTPTSGQVIIEPTPKNLQKFRGKFKSRCNRILKEKSAKERGRLIENLRQRVWGWSAAFCLWDGAIAHRHEHLMLVKGLGKPT